MITRREFLRGSMATLVLIPLAACSDDDSPMSANGSSACQGVSSTGSRIAGHVHTVCVPDSDLNNPPAGGRTYTTSSDSSHAHSVNLSQTQLETVSGGGSVTVTSSSTGHTHDFLIRRA